MRALTAYLFFAIAVTTTQASENINQALVTQNLTSMPLAFTQNMGQWPDSILFRASAGGATMWFTKDGVYYQFTRRVEYPDVDSVGRNQPASGGFDKAPDMASVRRNPRGFDMERDSIETMLIKATFVGANPNAEVVGEGSMEYKCNYFIGNDPAKWRADVPNYDAVTIRNVYEGVDLHFSGGAAGRLTYQYSIAPGVDVSQMKLAYEGVAEISQDGPGRMTGQTKWGAISGLLASPAANATLISGEFSLLSGDSPAAGVSRSVHVQSGSQPVELVFSTYLGGGSSDGGSGVALDGSGNAYVTGSTFSSNFPTKNPYRVHEGNADAFVTKFSAASNGLLYSTYLGGSGADRAWGIAVDGSGNAYVTGLTSSTDFPTRNPSQAHHASGSWDVFVTKFSATGNSLLYSTYLGGGDDDNPYGIAVDDRGNAYVTGHTKSTDFPTRNPFQADQGEDDAFVTRLSAAGNSLVYSTYLGGAGFDEGGDIAVDASGNAYVTGTTTSSDFPTQNPYQTVLFASDAFVTKLSPTGNGLVYSTYLGGGGEEWGRGIAVDDSGNAYVTGDTYSSDFPTQNPFQTRQGGYDVFVTKLSATGNNLIYSTYLGGGDHEGGLGIAVDCSGKACVTGYTWSTDFPTKIPYQTDQGNHDVFVTMLSATGNSLLYSTYLGGGSTEYGYGIAVDCSGNIYVTGDTGSLDFPTQNPFQAHHAGGGRDAFVTKFYGGNPCGDADGDMELTAADIEYLKNFYFSTGPQPPLVWAADMDCDGLITIADICILVGYYYGYGPAPCCAEPPPPPPKPNDVVDQSTNIGN